MNLQPRKDSIVVQDEVLLNTQGLIHKVGGITLDGSAFAPNGDKVIVKSGTAVMANAETGLFVPYADGAEGTFPAGAEVYLTAQDAVIKEKKNEVIGAFVAAYLNTEKLTGVTTAFKGATSGRYIYG